MKVSAFNVKVMNCWFQVSFLGFIVLVIMCYSDVLLWRFCFLFYTKRIQKQIGGWRGSPAAFWPDLGSLSQVVLYLSWFHRNNNTFIRLMATTPLFRSAFTENLPFQACIFWTPQKQPNLNGQQITPLMYHPEPYKQISLRIHLSC